MLSRLVRPGILIGGFIGSTGLMITIQRDLGTVIDSVDRELGVELEDTENFKTLTSKDKQQYLKEQLSLLNNIKEQNSEVIKTKTKYLIELSKCSPMNDRIENLKEIKNNLEKCTHEDRESQMALSKWHDTLLQINQFKRAIFSNFFVALPNASSSDAFKYKYIHDKKTE